jgi:hypothetical protein
VTPLAPTLDSVEAWVAERDAALIALDESYVAKTMPKANPAIRLLILHKARYEAVNVPAELRHASGKWLRDGGYVRLTGTPVLPEGELPE